MSDIEIDWNENGEGYIVRNGKKIQYVVTFEKGIERIVSRTLVHMFQRMSPAGISHDYGLIYPKLSFSASMNINVMIKNHLTRMLPKISETYSAGNKADLDDCQFAGLMFSQRENDECPICIESNIVTVSATGDRRFSHHFVMVRPCGHIFCDSPYGNDCFINYLKMKNCELPSITTNGGYEYDKVRNIECPYCRGNIGKVIKLKYLYPSRNLLSDIGIQTIISEAKKYRRN